MGPIPLESSASALSSSFCGCHVQGFGHRSPFRVFRVSSGELARLGPNDLHAQETSHKCRRTRSATSL
jgi:hypothetical protein